MTTSASALITIKDNPPFCRCAARSKCGGRLVVTLIESDRKHAGDEDAGPTVRCAVLLCDSRAT
jgi:hypothetical protein